MHFFQIHKEGRERGGKNNTVETSCIARFKLYIRVISYGNSENGKGHQEWSKKLSRWKVSFMLTVRYHLQRDDNEKQRFCGKLREPRHRSGWKKSLPLGWRETVTSFSVWRKISLIDLRPLKYIFLLEWNRLSNFYCFSFDFAKTYTDRIRNKVVHFVSICLIFKSRWKHELFKVYFINNSCLILFPSLSIVCCSDHWTKKRDETRKKYRESVVSSTKEIDPPCPNGSDKSMGWTIVSPV